MAMKRFLSMLLVCTLALTAGIALAADEEIIEYVEWLHSAMAEGYMGELEDGTTAFFAFGELEDGTFAMLVFMDPTQTQSASFVGYLTDNGDGSFTVEDDHNGLTITIGLEAVEGGFLLNLGEEGSGGIAPVDVAEVIDAFVIINYGTEAVA